MQLVKGMFGTEFGPSANTPFDLRTGQMRSTGKLTHNSGWYSGSGDKLGWGDLSASDFHRIQAQLVEGECFVVLSEQDSFWNFVTNIGRLGSLCTTEPTVEAPGRAYLAAHAQYIITKDKFLYVDEYGTFKDKGRMGHQGIYFNFITAEELQTLLQ